MRTKALLTGIVVAVATGAGASAAQACSIAAQTAQERFAAADRALTVRVVSVRFTQSAEEAPSDRGYVATLRVSRVYKGSASRRIRVRSDTGGSSCGWGPMRRGQRFGLLLGDGPAPPFVGLGSRIAYRELEQLTGGVSRPPRD